MKVLLIFIFALMSIFMLYANVYEGQENGVAAFSNTEFKGSKEINLSSEPITVVKTVELKNYSQKVYLDNTDKSYRDNNYSNNYSNQDTLRGSFPEEFTDNYYDFYGRNFQYQNLMSSTMGMSMYTQGGANNSRLENNY
ncbi:hypothetical protein FRA_45c13250 [Francisella sp. W12-1067]|nr:hypothetical protein FRA_45c13250 [Francisella sp. W12-1067]